MRICCLLLLGLLPTFARSQKASLMPPPAPPVLRAVVSTPIWTPEAKTNEDDLGDEDSTSAEAVPVETPLNEPLGYWKESADSLDHVTLSVSSGYDVLKSGPQIEGTGVFHLAHTAGTSTETITLDPALLAGADSKVFFESRLGIATSDQVAEVHVSSDNGSTWSTIWSQPGLGSPGQTRYHRQEIALADWAGETLRLRFRYRFSGGSYYPGSTISLGWLIDDIQIGETYILDPVPYSIGDPTNLEQHNLEFINRARASAAAEALRLKDTDDTDVVNAMDYYNVDTNALVEQFASLTETVQPLAFNAQLLATARLHSQDMLANDFQGHTSSANPIPPNEPYDSLSTRLQRQGYAFATASENVYANAQGVWHAHAAFNIDWGSGVEGSIGGMQNPPGHRQSIHNANFREIGIGIIEGSNTNVGPMLVTQNFGTQLSLNQPFITGVAWSDINENGDYDPGEGLGGIAVLVEGERFMAVTSASGGYAVPVFNNGTYTITFTSAVDPPWTTSTVVTNGDNVKVDYRRDEVPFYPVLSSFSPHALSTGGYQLSVTQAYRIPVLQYSEDLSFWSDLPDVDPESIGTNAYQFELPTPHVTPIFYRARFP